MSTSLAPVRSAALMQQNRYLIRRKLLSIFGQKFFIYDESENLIGFVKQKAFKLKEDIRVYSDTECTSELLVIKARQVIDFSAAYDVVESGTGQKLGAFRRKGMASTFVRDSWEILDNGDRVVGGIEEDSALLGMFRRYIFAFLPQTYSVTMNGAAAAEFKQTWNIFIPKMWCTFSAPTSTLDRRLGLAAGVLISAIEGKQNR